VRNVVVIDDDQNIADVLAAFLTSGGFQVKIATSAATGIRLVKETIPDAVVCDMRMPGGGGDTVIEALKEQPRTAHIPVLLVTSFCTPEILGIADALLLKPVRCNELVSTVEHLSA
jgi:CheY-like chemotaxis protein